MPSMLCGHCGKVKRCKMVLEEARSMVEGEGKPLVLYLCRPCSRELGYEDKP
jgi:hypothetical protein